MRPLIGGGLAAKMISIPPRDTSPYQDSAGTAPSGTPPPAQPPPPPQTRGTQSHSAPTPLKRPVLQSAVRLVPICPVAPPAFSSSHGLRVNPIYSLSHFSLTHSLSPGMRPRLRLGLPLIRDASPLRHRHTHTHIARRHDRMRASEGGGGGTALLCCTVICIQYDCNVCKDSNLPAAITECERARGRGVPPPPSFFATVICIIS